jgi:hypothetical protein
MVALIGNRKAITFGDTTTAGNTSIGDAFGLLAKPFLDTLTPAIKRQQLMDKEREAANILVQQNLLRQATDGRVNAPEFYAAGIGAGMTGANASDYILGLTGNVRGAQDNATTNAAVASGKNWGGTYHGNQAALANARTLQAMQEATKLKVADNELTPVLAPGPDGRMVPTYQRKGAAVGMPASVGMSEQKGALLSQNWNNLPGLNENQQKALDALPPDDQVVNAQLGNGSTRPAVRRPDGYYDAHSGQRLDNVVSVGKLVANTAEGLGGSSLTNKIVERRVSHQQALGAIDRLDQKLAAPNADQAVGYIGRGAIIFNDIRAQFEAATRLKGGLTLAQEKASVLPSGQTVDATIDATIRNPKMVSAMQQLGVDAAVIRANITDLAYTIAKAKDPGGRMSDQDITRAGDIIGLSLMNPAAAREVLQELKLGLNADHQIWEQEFGRVRGGGTSNLTDRGNTITGITVQDAPLPPPAAPQAQGAIPDGRTATGPGGQKIIMRGGQWVPMQ